LLKTRSKILYRFAIDISRTVKNFLDSRIYFLFDLQVLCFGIYHLYRPHKRQVALERAKLLQKSSIPANKGNIINPGVQAVLNSFLCAVIPTSTCLSTGSLFGYTRKVVWLLGFSNQKARLWIAEENIFEKTICRFS
jgi:hypothetical protein